MSSEINETNAVSYAVKKQNLQTEKFSGKTEYNMNRRGNGSC